MFVFSNSNREIFVIILAKKYLLLFQRFLIQNLSSERSTSTGTEYNSRSGNARVVVENSGMFLWLTVYKLEYLQNETRYRQREVNYEVFPPYTCSKFKIYLTLHLAHK